MSAIRETFNPRLHINSCMSNSESYKLIAQDVKKWAEKKVNGSDRQY